ncbi:hypothetical protein [Desulfogranum marinum]|uniref:hypothetical protein n=1 Tax=Desulfogranum marinum TaxID=453220 RepID=UPI0029C77311|nr:hypothetical protein [Desulfogranum marinum]
MISNNNVDQCRLAYDKHFEGVLISTGSQELAVESCAHYYLDSKPVKKGITAQIRSIAFWKCNFWQTLPSTYFSSDLIAYALGRSLYFDFDDHGALKKLMHHAPETLKRGIRYSQIFLRPDSQSWAQIQKVSAGASDDFQDFLRACHYLHEELLSHDQIIAELQRQLDTLTVFEFLLYGSLFSFQNLVPDPLRLAELYEQWLEHNQKATDALNELLVWKLRTRDENDLRLNERFLTRSLKQHLMPLLLPGESNPTLCFKNLELFTELIAAVVRRTDFLHQTVFEFCFDDDYRYKFEGDHLTIYPVEIPEESEWDFNGRKLSALHEYWFNRAFIQYSQSDLPNQEFGTPENDTNNRLAYIKACQVYLQLDEIFGLDPKIALPDGTDVDLFKALHSLELMTAFFNVSYIAKFQEHYQTSGNWLKALSQLMLEGISIGENRFPLTWTEPSEKAQRIKSWTVSESNPEGNIKQAEAILEFWSNDLKSLAQRIKKQPYSPVPEFHEQPIINLGNYGLQLPWLMASQNNSTAAVNNLRRIGSRRKSRQQETHLIEARLGDVLKDKGFAVVQSYQPDIVNGSDPGEVDLICYMDGHILVLEIKSTYIRKTKQEAWIHRTTTLRKASQQIKRKEKAIAHAIEGDVDLQSKLQLPAQKGGIKIHPWIVDTSIEHDQELIGGYLKVSLEGLIVILRNERQLLAGNLLTKDALPEDDMFPDGFSAQRFIEIVEGGELWSVLQG